MLKNIVWGREYKCEYENGMSFTSGPRKVARRW